MNYDIEYLIKIIYKISILQKSINSLQKAGNCVIDLYLKKKQLEIKLNYIKNNYELKLITSDN